MSNPSEEGSGSGMPSSESRNWAMAAHLAPSVVNLLSGGMGGIIVTIIIYFIKKGEDEFVVDAAKEALNFQITVFFAAMAALIMILSAILACIGLPILLLLGFAALIFGIIAGVQVNKGVRYRYPFCIRLIS